MCGSAELQVDNFRSSNELPQVDPPPLEVETLSLPLSVR